MKSRNDAGRRARTVLQRLEKAYPGAKLALDFSNPFQLLVALILAAQCTDEKVNELTGTLLFRKYRTPADFLRVPVEELEKDIHPTGFFRNKAKAIRRCCEQLIEKFDSNVPDTIEELTSLYGIGRKSANILLGNAFGQDAIGVDTHVGRLAQRLGFSKNTDPDKIEADLTATFPRKLWTHSCHLLQAHGRRTCFARRPNCPECTVRDLCPFPDKTEPVPKRALRPAFGRRA